MNIRESFLVRIWRDDTCDASEMRGEVEHVRTGQKARFCGAQELLAILDAWTTVEGDGDVAEPEDDSHLDLPPMEPPEQLLWMW